MQNNLDPTDLPGLLETASYVAQQTDRWMFVAMLIIFIVAGAMMTRYFTKELQKARSEFQDLSKEFTVYLQQANKDLAAALVSNTHALERVLNALQKKEN